MHDQAKQIVLCDTVAPNSGLHLNSRTTIVLCIQNDNMRITQL
jgi:hypothetical protein